MLFSHMGSLAESGSQEQRTGRTLNVTSLIAGSAGYSQGQGGHAVHHRFLLSEICEDNILNQTIFHQLMSSVCKRKCDWYLPVQKLCSCKCDCTFGRL